jgi:hypothetical protein
MYKSITDEIIQRADGAFIPVDMLNADYQAFLAWQAEGGVLEPRDPPLSDVPQEVSAGQAYATLMAAGLYDDVQAWAEDPDTNVLHRLAFQKGTTFRRDSPALAAGSAALGWDDAMLDQLFIAADKIQL